MENLYERLGLHREATEQDIKQAYWSKAKTMHPDVGGNADQFAEIADAYRILSSAELRNQYDQFGFTIDVDVHHLAVESLAHHIQKIVEDAIMTPFFGAAWSQELSIYEDIRISLTNTCNNLNSSIHQIQKQMGKFEKFREHVVKSQTTPPGDLALAILKSLEGKLANCRAELKNLEIERLVSKCCLELISDQQYLRHRLFDILERVNTTCSNYTKELSGFFPRRGYGV